MFDIYELDRRLRDHYQSNGAPYTTITCAPDVKAAFAPYFLPRDIGNSINMRWGRLAIVLDPALPEGSYILS